MNITKKSYPRQKKKKCTNAHTQLSKTVVVLRYIQNNKEKCKFFLKIKYYTCLPFNIFDKLKICSFRAVLDFLQSHTGFFKNYFFFLLVFFRVRFRPDTYEKSAYALEVYPVLSHQSGVVFFFIYFY